MTLDEIKSAVDNEITVHWSNELYQVVKGKFDYLIKCTQNNYCIGLTWADGTTLNGKESEFLYQKDRYR